MTGVGQSDFTKAILQADLPVPEGLSDGQGHPAGKRFAVYRNNVAVSLTEALETAFPTVKGLVGDDFFRALAGVFLRQHPPSSPLMMFYGAEMPQFLEHFEPVAHLPYMADAARIDLALRHAYHARDVEPLAADALGQIPPEKLGEVRLTPAPATRILRSAYPLHGIWLLNRGGPKPGKEAEDVLITRPELDPEVDLLPQGGAAFLAALLQGETLGAANDRALAETADFDLGACLGLALQRRAFCALN